MPSDKRLRECPRDIIYMLQTYDNRHFTCFFPICQPKTDVLQSPPYRSPGEVTFSGLGSKGLFILKKIRKGTILWNQRFGSSSRLGYNYMRSVPGAHLPPIFFTFSDLSE